MTPLTRWLSPANGPFRLVEPLLRVGLWAFAFWIGYRLQIRLEHRHVDWRELAYLVSAALCIAAAAWPRGASADSVGEAPPTGFFTRHGRWTAIAAPLCVVAAAGALGVFFRIYDLNAKPVGIWYDEAQNGLIARRILDGDFPPMFIGLDTQLPSAFFYIYALSAWVMGEGVLSLRAVSTIGGLAALPMVFLLARQLFGVRTAALAVFLLAVMRWQVNFSRFGVTNIFASFFVLGAVYFFVRGLRGGPRWSFIASGVFLGLTPYAGFYGVFAPIVIGLYWLHAGIFERVLTWRRHALALLIVAVVALAAYSPVAAWGLKNGDAYLSRPGTASISQGKTAGETYHAVLTSTRTHLLMFKFNGRSERKTQPSGRADARSLHRHPVFTRRRTLSFKAAQVGQLPPAHLGSGILAERHLVGVVRSAAGVPVIGSDARRRDAGGASAGSVVGHRSAITRSGDDGRAVEPQGRRMRARRNGLCARESEAPLRSCWA